MNGPTPNEVGRAVVARRRITAARLARECGVSASSISRWIAGDRDLSGESLGKVFAALDLRVVEGRGGLR